MPQWLTRHKWLLIVGAVAIGLLIFAACNGDDDDDGDGVTPADGETPAAVEVEALAAICFPESCRTALREAIGQGLIDQFIFVDGSKSQDMFDDIGVENFEGMSGTAPGAADADLAQAFEDAYNASEFGPIPALPFLRESYDAVYLIALAAAAANSTDSADIRDNLRYIANPGGEVINPGTAGFTTALGLLDAGDDIDYEGAAGSQDFDENGDVARGAVEIWKIVDGEITVQENRPFELTPGAPTGSLSRSDTTPTEPLKIGILVPFTGDLSDFGAAFFDAARLAEQEINAAGGVFGQDIVLVDADTGTVEATGVESANTLIDVEGVHAIVGAASSGVTLPIAESVTGPAGILQISPSSTSPALSAVNDNDFLFRSTISDAAQGVILADLAIELGFTSVCTFFVNTAYGEGLSDQFKETFESLGGTVPASVPHEQEQTTYVSELQTCVGG